MRASFIRLIGSLLIASILAQLGALPARADNAEDVQALNRHVDGLFDQGKYAEALSVAERAL